MRIASVAVVMMLALSLLASGAFAANAAKEAKATVMGKIEVKTEKLANKEIKVAYIIVSEAKGAEGKPMADLKGKTLKITGPKVADIEKMAGKDVTLTGMVKGNAIQAMQVVEKKKTPAPTSAPEPAAAPE